MLGLISAELYCGHWVERFLERLGTVPVIYSIHLSLVRFSTPHLQTILSPELASRLANLAEPRWYCACSDVTVQDWSLPCCLAASFSERDPN